MKRVALFLALAACCIIIKAQEPQGFNYQALLSDSLSKKLIETTFHTYDSLTVTKEFSYAIGEQQIPFRRNAIYIEMLGQGIFYSVNYDYRLSRKISLRAGFTIWSINSIDFLLIQITDLKYKSFFVMGNYLTGTKSNHLELGLGLMPTFYSGDVSFLYFLKSDSRGYISELLGTATLGYRYQRDEGGFIFRISVAPIFSTSGAVLIGGLSIGFGF
ncbi:MAG TPA: hypothetical protein VMV77_03820 [Bacteroidales bacterium]|nr:hypothetical protein [Bacteroidales bacterium]